MHNREALAKAPLARPAASRVDGADEAEWTTAKTIVFTGGGNGADEPRWEAKARSQTAGRAAGSVQRKTGLVT
jgi:hypothetical protein